MKTVRRPPYPKWNPGYFPCSFLIPLPLSSRRPSVSFGGFGLKGELQSERMTREELQRMRKEGRVKSDEELEMVFGLATDTIRKRSNANIPLNRQELLNLIELIRGADGL